MHRRQKCMQSAYGKEALRGSSRYKKDDNMTRCDSSYFFADVSICRRMYLFLHKVSLTRYNNLKTHFDEYGLSARVHKSAKKPAKRNNELTFDEIHNIVHFIENFAEKVAIPLPGRLPKFRDYRVMKLPSSENKQTVYDRFKKACADSGDKLVERTTFSKIWNKYCPYIATMRPADDLCKECHNNSLAGSRAANLTEEMKAEALQSAVNHSNAAQQQRDFYNLWRKKSNVRRAQKYESFIF